MKAYIYSLSCPIKNEPVYIGSTINLYRRGKEHISEIKDNSAPVYKYFRDLSVDPIMNVVEEIEYSRKTERIQREEFWINDFIQRGYAILNVHRYSDNKNINYKPTEFDLVIIELLSYGHTVEEISSVTCVPVPKLDSMIYKLRCIYSCKTKTHLVATFLRRELIK